MTRTREKTPQLLLEVRWKLVELADPVRAEQARAYMKSAMPFHGVPMPEVRRIARECAAGLTWADGKAWRDALAAMWRAAEFREERYAVLAIARHRCSKAHRDAAAIELYEEFIVTGAWWDLVDEVSSHLVAPLVDEHPKVAKARLRAWSRSSDLWLRRAAIIGQLPLGERTDVPLLVECIERAIDSKEFFLRKAIGWALRTYAATDPDFVRVWVREHEDRLSPLSRREALKHLGA